MWVLWQAMGLVELVGCWVPLVVGWAQQPVTDWVLQLETGWAPLVVGWAQPSVTDWVFQPARGWAQ
jgi:hypothetical protein